MPVSRHSFRFRGFSWLCWAGLAACSTPAPITATPARAAPPAVTRLSWPRFAEVAAWPAVTDTALPNQGHDVAVGFARVHTNPEARDTYMGLVQDSVLPDGSVVALFHESADGATRGPVYVMEKAAGRWHYLVLDAEGHEEPTAKLDTCAGCHADATADQLFGLPRRRRPDSSPTSPAGARSVE